MPIGPLIYAHIQSQLAKIYGRLGRTRGGFGRSQEGQRGVFRIIMIADVEAIASFPSFIGDIPIGLFGYCTVHLQCTNLVDNQ